VADRKGEKVGWIGGWLGGFIWVVILSIVFLVQMKLAQGVVGLILAGLAVVMILANAPWKKPETAYWKLMLPVYIMFTASVGWAVWTAGGIKPLGLSAWNGFMILPILIPFWTTGRRKWTDGSVRETADPD
jgi:uncharacterized membrane protein YfcA